MVTTVVVEVIDGKIWDPARVALEIVAAAAKGDVVIDLGYESPCVRSSGLESMLDRICEIFGYQWTSFTILTGNQLPSSQYKEKINSVIYRLYNCLSVHSDSLNHVKWNGSQSIGLFVGRSNWLRLALASYLYRCHGSQSLITYHYNHTLDYCHGNLQIEEYVARNWNNEEFDQVIDFLKVLPLTQGQTIDQFPIRWEQYQEMNGLYENIFCELVCETFFSGNTFRMSEKILRPILFRRPFVVQGPRWFLKNLRAIGFRTFDQWWDESYDDQPWDCRYYGLKPVLDRIATSSVEQKQTWLREMQPVLDHNFKILQDLKNKDWDAVELFSPMDT